MKTSRHKRALSDQEFDDYFKNQLEGHPVKPKASNWITIRHWNSLFFLKSVWKAKFLYVATAAIILFLLGIPFLRADDPSLTPPPRLSGSNSDWGLSAHEMTCESKNSSFVLDITQGSVIIPEEDIIRKEIIEQEIEAYLAFLLNDKDEFSDKVDSAEIANSLTPAQQLPIDEMFAHIPELPEPEVYTILAPLETRITLPHRFIENELDVEDYLAHYERNTKRKNSY